ADPPVGGGPRNQRVPKRAFVNFTQTPTLGFATELALTPSPSASAFRIPHAHPYLTKHSPAHHHPRPQPHPHAHYLIQHAPAHTIRTRTDLCISPGNTI
ncbi:uncharacterized protein PAN0_097c6697, partial [Moesziomyces antarcticus]